MARITGVTFLFFFLICVSFAQAHLIADYPGTHITNGAFNGKIVIGEEADALDIMGAIDLAASVQRESVLTTEETTSQIVGDIKGIYGGNMQIRKKPSTMFVPGNLKAFTSGTITTRARTTQYEQYLTIGGAFVGMAVNLLENDDDEISDYLVMDNTGTFLEWEGRFPQGLVSQVDSDQRLTDLEERTFNIMGTDFSIVTGTIDDDGTDLVLTLRGGAVADTLREGEESVYTIDGTDYEVTLVFVSDPNSATPEVKFSVNGELTKALTEGDTEIVGQNLELGVRDILVNPREGVATFYLGAKKIIFTDPTPTAVDDFDGTVEVDNEYLNDADLTMVGAFTAGENASFQLDWIKYRLQGDPSQGGEFYIPAGHSLSEYMDEPQALLGTVDFRYEGINPTTRKQVKIYLEGDDQYRMSMVNNERRILDFPLLSNKDGLFRFGDEDDDLIFVEGSSAADHTIGFQDYFIVSNNRGTADADKAVTDVLRYTDYDATYRVLELTNADGSILNVPISIEGTGKIVVGTHKFSVNVSDITAAQPLLAVDLDADNGYGDVVDIAVHGEFLIDLSELIYLNDSVNASDEWGNLSQIVGNGKNISTHPGFVADSGFVRFQGTVLSKQFSTPSEDEVFNWTISQSDDEIDLTFTASDYSGPASTDTSDPTYGFHFDEFADEDVRKALTDFGIIITLSDPTRDPAELTLDVPQGQVMATTYLTSGKVIREARTKANFEVKPIEKGLAVLDSDAMELLGIQDLLVIGGPCVNKITAYLLDNPENCAEGFEPGHAMIQLFELENDAVAIVIAGYSGEDTLTASRVLAEHLEYDLNSSKVDINVQLGNAVSIISLDE